MSITGFLASLQKLDIRLWLEAGRLRYDAPEGALTEELRAGIIERKQEIIDFLHTVHNSELEKVPSIKPAPRNGKLPLSYAQKWLWLYSQRESSSFAYNIPVALRLSGQLNIAALQESINEIIHRHEILRTTFRNDDNDLYQYLETEFKINLPVTDLSMIPDSQREAKVKEFLNIETRLPFNLEQGPLIRAGLMVLGEDESVLLITIHHIVSDNWSLNIFMGELAELYKAYVTGKPSKLPALDIQYADYAVWQQSPAQSKAMEPSLAYWRERLNNIEAIPALPTDYARPEVQTHNSIRQFTILPLELTRKLKELSQSENCTLYVIILAAFQVLLHQYTGFRDIIVGTPVAGRTHMELEKLIGVFINTVVLWNSVDNQMSFRNLIREVRKTTGEAFAHQEVPLEMLAEELQTRKGQARKPLFQVLFNMFNASFELDLPDLQITPFSMEVVGAQNLNSKFDIALLVIEHRGSLQIDFSLNADVFAGSTAGWLMDHFKRLLESVAVNADCLLPDFPELQPRQHVNTRPNNPFTVFESTEVEQTLIQRFEKQVIKWPEHIAVESDGRRLSYSELNKLANQTGHLILKNNNSRLGLSKQEKIRYSRQIVLEGWGIEAQEKLKGVTVFAAGAGGSGSPTIMQLALLGVGTIIICDFDVVELSNLNRQALHDESRLGMNKAESAAMTVKRMNPNVNVIARTEKLTRDNISELAAGALILFDNLDDIEAKFVLSEYAVAGGIPHVISSMIERSSYSAILHTPYTPCFHCLYDRSKLDTVRELRSEKNGWNKVTNPVASPALFLSTGFACNEALKIILGLENIAYNKYFFFNQQASAQFAQTKGYKIVTYPFSKHFRELCKKQGFDWEKGFDGRFIQEIDIEKDPACSMCGSKAVTAEKTIAAPSRLVSEAAVGIGPGNSLADVPNQPTVALLMEHDLEMVIGILGVLKTGGIFVTMDPSYPEERLAYILEDTGARVILTDDSNQAIAEKISDKVSRNIKILNMKEIHLYPSMDNLPEYADPESLAYIMYTSGSLGYPKGVTQKHRNVLHYIMNYTNGTHISHEDKLSLIPSFSFSAAMMDTFAALLNGATLCLFNIRKRGTAELGKWLTDEAITVYHSVPTIFRHLMAAVAPGMSFPYLRLIDFGGEPVSSADVQLFKQHCSEDCILVNGLGATELNVIRQYCINKDTELIGNLVPVGYPVEDTEILLIDEEGRKVKYNRPGEIVIKSDFLSPGYWGMEEQTEQAFKPDPYDSKRLYFTGDLGRFRTDGCLEHLGRKDLQVKIRGIRIEPAEIETALLEIPSIREAAVVAEENGQDGRQLVAYLVEKEHHKINLDETIAHLRDRLPAYMVPASFIKLASFPLTLTGKVDRRRLAIQGAELKQTWNSTAAQEVQATDGKSDSVMSDTVTAKPFSGEQLGGRSGCTAPQNHTEELLCRIWKNVLKLEQVSVDADFFQIGGDSLSGLRMIDLAHQQGLDLNPTQLSQYRTIAKLVHSMEDADGGKSAKPIIGERLDTGMSFAAPRNETENLLCGIWKSVLKLELVGIDDDFFQIGGDSLSGLRMIDLAHQRGLLLNPTQLSQNRTISKLAQSINNAPDKVLRNPINQTSELHPDFCEEVTPDSKRVIPLTSSQAWYLSTVSERVAPSRFNLYALMETDFRLNPFILKKAVAYVCDCHEALRARFIKEDDGWKQYIEDTIENTPFEAYNLSGLPEEEQKEAIEKTADRIQASMDIANGRLFRVAHFHLGENRSERLFIVMHHIVGDNYSFGILLNELQTAYYQLIQNGNIAKNVEITPFAEFTEALLAYCHSRQLESEVDYWLNLPWGQVARLTPDFPDNTGRNTEGSNTKLTVTLSEEETKKLLYNVPEYFQTTLENLLIICLVDTIGQWMEEDWVYIEAVDSGRTTKPFLEGLDLSHTVGWISSARSLVLKRSDKNCRYIHDKIHFVDEQIKSVPNQGVGYTYLARLGDESNISVKKLQLEYKDRQLFFNYLGQVENEPSGFRTAKENPGLRNHPDEARTFYVECVCFIKEGKLYQQWNFSCNLHRQYTIEQVANNYLSYLIKIIEQTEIKEANP